MHETGQYQMSRASDSYGPVAVVHESCREMTLGQRGITIGKPCVEKVDE